VSVEQVIEADWTWIGGAFTRNIRVAVDANGRIAQVGALAAPPTVRFPGKALLPGIINVHSHAFQRGLRGLGEAFPHGAGTFWTWREAMYRLVDAMDAEALYRLSHQAFREMLACGITTVGEFHYLHHAAGSWGFEFDEVVLRAARDAGIRIVLLNCYYKTGGIGKPLTGGQLRFDGVSVLAFWRQMEHIATRLDPATQSLGVAPHSIRAVGIDDIVALRRESRKRGMVFHIHVEEQQREVAECRAAYGQSPMVLLTDRLEIDETVTAIHCTHTDSSDMSAFVGAGGQVCLCPLTEGNLGDGIPDLTGIRAAGGRICVGTDSNARLCMTEDLRWMEYGQRLKTQTRGRCVDAAGSAANALWEIATINGARSLGLTAGRIEAGCWADFVVLDLAAPSLAGWMPETLLDAFIFGTGESVIAATCVGGNFVPSQ